MHILKQLTSAAPICIYLPNAQIQTCIRCFQFSEAPGVDDWKVQCRNHIRFPTVARLLTDGKKIPRMSNNSSTIPARVWFAGACAMCGRFGETGRLDFVRDLCSFGSGERWSGPWGKSVDNFLQPNLVQRTRTFSFRKSPTASGWSQWLMDVEFCENNFK